MSPEPFSDGRDGNFSGAPGGKPLNAGADGREGDCRQRVIRGDFQTAPVTAGQQRFFIGPAAPLDRPYRVDDITRPQIVAAGDPGIARIAAV